MADITAHTTRPATRSGLRAVFAAIGDFFETAANANSRVRRVHYLQSLSDAELAQRGLTRDRIVHHVFCDLYYI